MPRKPKAVRSAKADTLDKRDRMPRGAHLESVPFPFATTICAALLACFVMAIYWQVTSHEFLVCDDNTYVTENPQVGLGLTWEGVWWAFGKPHAGNYHPLSWISHMADVEWFGMDAGAHHLTNVVLHAATAVLVLVTLRAMTGRFWAPVLAAYLFALHPLRVESVAWVAERKDVLCGFFWMSTMLAYVGYVRVGRTHEIEGQASVPRTRTMALASRYFLVMVLYFAAILSKSMAVTLPCVLLLCDYWPLARHRPADRRHANKSTAGSRAARQLLICFLEKLPLMLFAAAGAVNSLEAVPLDGRIANVLVTYVSYLTKTVIPWRLSVFYPHPVVLEHELPAGLMVKAAVAGIFLLGVTGAALATCRRWPHFIVGWLWYLGMLVPVIGFVQVGTQAMADRYTYLPSIGLAIVAAWFACDMLLGTGRRRRILVATSLAVLAALTVLSWRYTRCWRDSFRLFEHAASVTERNYFAYNHIGLAYEAAHDAEQARQAFERAIEMNPGYDFGHNNLAVYFSRKGDLETAVQHLRIALEANPQYVDANSNLGVVYEMMGQLENAEMFQRRAIELQGDRPDSHYNLGIVYQKMKRWQDAADSFERAIRLNPSHAKAYHSRGLMEFELGNRAKAAESLQQSIRLDPRDPAPYNALGLLYQHQNDWAQAERFFRESLRIQADQPKIEQLLQQSQRRQRQ